MISTVSIGRRLMVLGYQLTGRHHASVAVDIAERTFAVCLFLNLAYRFLIASDSISLVYLLIAVSELFVVLFVLVRKLTIDVSLRPLDWFVAAMGTCLPLLVVPAEPAPLVSPALCTSMILFGICLQITSKLFLNRSFGIVPANRGVKTRGPYAFVRHPIYLGYTFTHIGFVLFAPSAWNALVYVLAFGFQVRRMDREELILSEDSSYRDYKQAVPRRLLPGLY